MSRYQEDIVNTIISDYKEKLKDDIIKTIKNNASLLQLIKDISNLVVNPAEYQAQVNQEYIESILNKLADELIKYKFDNQLLEGILQELKQRLYQARQQRQQEQERQEEQGQAGGKGSKRKYTRRYVKK
jgi:signal recognition particle GTPase